CTHCHPPRQCSLWLSALSWFCSTECFGASFRSTGPTKEPTPNIAATTRTSPITSSPSFLATPMSVLHPGSQIVDDFANGGVGHGGVTGDGDVVALQVDM